MGKPIDRTDNPSKRLSNLVRIALGQSKMVTKPISGFLHVIVYVGFIIINIGHQLQELIMSMVTEIFFVYVHLLKIMKTFQMPS